MLDAGTGIRELGIRLEEEHVTELDLLISHATAQQIVNQIKADGITLLRPVERDRSDAGVISELEIVVAHK